MTWDWWLVLGFVAQGLFSMRFGIQWFMSERRKESYIPIAFWYFSLGGGILLLTYSLHIKDPVFIVGQACGVFVYSRNLYFIYRKRAADKGATA